MMSDFSEDQRALDVFLNDGSPNVQEDSSVSPHNEGNAAAMTPPARRKDILSLAIRVAVLMIVALIAAATHLEFHKSRVAARTMQICTTEERQS